MNESTTLSESSLETLRAVVDSRLEAIADQISNSPSGLQDAMQYSLLAGGKRLRPVLVLLSCEACGGNIDDALPAACAIEFVHTYSLIHDDLPAMDDDDLRRGRPTNHVVYGEANAILAGDGLLTYAFEILATQVRPPETAAACCADLARAAGPAGMVGGQFADLEAENRDGRGRRPHDLNSLDDIHRRKTGCLIAAALRLGARIAGADDASIAAVAAYGKCVGLAFQIADDLLDLRGNDAKMGKRTQKDADRGKLTYPELIGEADSAARARQLIDDACEHLAPLGERGHRLESLAHFMIQRDH